MSQQQITEVTEWLRHYPDPHTDRPLAELCRELQVMQAADDTLQVQLTLMYPMSAAAKNQFAELLVRDAAVAGYKIQISMGAEVITHAIGSGLPPLPQVKNIIAVASAKGGVGKSTTAVHLALALQAEGARVGLLDADIYGPSVALMLGVQKSAASQDQKWIQPIIAHGLQTMSMAYLVDAAAAMIWRGPMVTSALQQLVYQTAWQQLDYLVIDLPPGTGDIQLTLAQKIPVSGVVVVTTPQEVALIDARKAIAMFNKVKVPILGIVENMSFYECTHCQHAAHLFGRGGARTLAAQFNLPLLAEIPLQQELREGLDVGHPFTLQDPHGTMSQCYQRLACRASAFLALQQKVKPVLFPKIVIEN